MESILIARFLTKYCIFEKSPKNDFSAKKVLNKGKKNIFWLKSPKISKV